jgi:nucleoside 2-deoxyribosyltransferase
MNTIVICCSIAVSDKVVPIQEELMRMGFEVVIPHGVQQYIDNGHKHVRVSERTKTKKELDLLSRYFAIIQKGDCVLVINTEKDGKPNYIGGNTFLEMGFAHVLGKPMYVLDPLPDVSYRDEIDAMNLRVIDGDLSLIQKA